MSSLACGSGCSGAGNLLPSSAATGGGEGLTRLYRGSSLTKALAQQTRRQGGTLQQTGWWGGANALRACSRAGSSSHGSHHKRDKGSWNNAKAKVADVGWLTRDQRDVVSVWKSSKSSCCSGRRVVGPHCQICQQLQTGNRLAALQNKHRANERATADSEWPARNVANDKWASHSPTRASGAG